MPITVIKASGETEEFRLEKLADSLVRSGAPYDVALDVARRVEAEISPATRTRNIYRLAKRLLRAYNHASTMRYSLKKAISDLGPSGYPFEKYFARVLEAYGYEAELNLVMEGYCVSHEVDILARKGGESFAIECKYHNDGGKPTDVKVALYVHSRAEDLKKAHRAGRLKEPVKQGWLATNTRLTSDAVKYARCAGLKIVSWRYPEGQSLERLIEDKRLYPVTALTSAKKRALGSLFGRNIVLASEIAAMDEQEFLRRSGLPADTARALKREADRLCG